MSTIWKQTITIVLLLLLTSKSANSQNCNYQVQQTFSTTTSEPKFEYDDYYDYYGELAYEPRFSIVCKNIVLEKGEELVVAKPSILFQPASDIILVNCTVPVLSKGIFDKYTVVQQLHLEGNNITELETGALDKLILLEELHLENNIIKGVPFQFITKQTHLKILNISHNNLEVLSPMPWNVNFTQLSLSYNRLNYIPLSALILPTLETLDLSHNQLSDINTLLFSDLLRLEKLQLNHNAIKTINPNLFQNTKLLHALDMSFNNISQINFGCMPPLMQHLNLQSNKLNSAQNLSALINIVTLDLQRNNLKFLEPVPKSLDHLHLNWNNFTELNAPTFNNASSLKELSIRHNFLTKIDKYAFKGLKNLVVLNLDHNLIENIEDETFAYAVSVRLLNLSHNALIEVGFDTFTSMKNLEELDLSYNKIGSFPDNPFHSLYSLSVLDVSHNALTSFDVDYLLQYTPSLRGVALDGNNYSCEVLENILEGFKKRFVYTTVLRGNDPRQPSIKGISCTGTTDERLVHELDDATTTTSPKIESLTTNAPLLPTLEHEIGNVLKHLFEKQLSEISAKPNSKDNKMELPKCTDKNYITRGFLEMLEEEASALDYEIKIKDFFSSSVLKDIDEDFHDTPVFKYLREKLLNCTYSHDGFVVNTSATSLVNSPETPEMLYKIKNEQNTPGNNSKALQKDMDNFYKNLTERITDISSTNTRITIGILVIVLVLLVVTSMKYWGKCLNNVKSVANLNSQVNHNNYTRVSEPELELIQPDNIFLN